MTNKSSDRAVSRFELDESRVAVFLYRLFRKSAKANSNGVQVPLVPNEHRKSLLAAMEVLNEYVETNDPNATDENRKTIAEACRKLKKKDLPVTEAVRLMKSVLGMIKAFCKIEFFEFLLADPERRTVIAKTLRSSAEWSSFMPIESLSLAATVEKLYEPYQRELSAEMDMYANRNYDITFNSVVLLCTTIALTVTVAAAPWGSVWTFIRSIPHSPFYFAVAAFYWYVTIVFTYLFLANEYRQKKVNYSKEFLRTITDPMQNPEHIDEEYLVHILESFKMMGELKDPAPTKGELAEKRMLLRMAIDSKSGGFIVPMSARLRSVAILFTEWGWGIVLTLSYAMLSAEMYLLLNS